MFKRFGHYLLINLFYFCQLVNITSFQYANYGSYQNYNFLYINMIGTFLV